LSDGQTNIGTHTSTANGIPQGFSTGGNWGSAYTGDMKGRKTIIYKAPEGFAIKIQTSDFNTGNFTNKPIYIGIVSAV
jgi:hypothetical protein